MTIAIKITNSDSRETAIVKVSKIIGEEVRGAIDNQELKITRVGHQELKGGESLEWYVHSRESILVEEVKNG